MYALIDTKTGKTVKESKSYVEILNESGKLNNELKEEKYACKYIGWLPSGKLF